MVFRSDGGVEEAMSGTGVYEGMDQSIWNKIRGNCFGTRQDLGVNV